MVRCPFEPGTVARASAETSKKGERVSRPFTVLRTVLLRGATAILALIAAITVLSPTSSAGAFVGEEAQLASASPLYHWTNLTTPSACCGPVAYDPSNRSVVSLGPPTRLFDNGTWGGYHPGSAITLQWNGTNWVPFSAAYDARAGAILALALTPCRSAPCPLEITLWSWSDWNWTFLGLVPQGLWAGAHIVYDSEDGYALVSGAGTSNATHLAPELTWTYEAGLWTNVTATAGSPPWGASAWADDPTAGYVVAFGGCRDWPCTGTIGETATFHGGAWTNVTSRWPTAPAPRAGEAMAYFSGCGCVVLFGGYGNGGYSREAYRNDTWTFGPGGWTNATANGPSPPPQFFSNGGMSDDPINDAVVIFGGVSRGTAGGFWAWGNYTAPRPTATPPTFPPLLLLGIAVPAAIVALIVLLLLVRRRRRRKVEPAAPSPPSTWA